MYSFYSLLTIPLFSIKKIFILTDNITVLKLLKKAAKKAGSIKIEICLGYIHKESAWKIFEDQKML